MSILSAIKAQSGTLTDLAKLPQALIMQMAQKGQIAQDMVMPILSKKAEMVEAARAMQNAQQQGGVPPTTVLEQIMQQNAMAEQPAPERGIETLDTGRMNPEQYAGGGIVSFEHGGEVPSYAGTKGSVVRTDPSFPRIDDLTQVGRDQDKRSILIQELKTEQNKFVNEVDPENKLRIQKNIDAINREISRIPPSSRKTKIPSSESVIPYANATGIAQLPKKVYPEVKPGDDAVYDDQGNLISGTRPEGPSTRVGLSDHLIPGRVEQIRAAEAAERKRKASELPVETGTAVDAQIEALRKANTLNLNRDRFNAEDRNKPGLASLEKDPYLTGEKILDESLRKDKDFIGTMEKPKIEPVTANILELPEYVQNQIAKQPQKTPVEILERTKAARAAAGYTDEANEKKLEDIKAEREALPEEERQNKWMALAEMGVAIAAGDSPYALQNIAKGGTKGIEAYKTYGKEIKEKKRLLREREDRLADLKQAERLRDADAIVAAQDKVDATNQQIELANIEITNKAATKVFDGTREVRMEMYKKEGLDNREIYKVENELKIRNITDVEAMKRMVLELASRERQTNVIYGSMNPKKTGELTRDDVLDAYSKAEAAAFPNQFKKLYPNGIIDYARKELNYDWKTNKMIGGVSASPDGRITGTYDPARKQFIPAQ